jgi:hypothetical protein
LLKKGPNSIVTIFGELIDDPPIDNISPSITFKEKDLFKAIKIIQSLISILRIINPLLF